MMVPVPFDPDTVWGTKSEHRVSGTVNGMNVRASVEPLGDGFGIVLGPAWRRDCGVAAGDVVDVVLSPEGPQREELADDIRAALDAEPAAGAFFYGLAQFYWQAYLRWIDATMPPLAEVPQGCSSKFPTLVGLDSRWFLLG